MTRIQSDQVGRCASLLFSVLLWSQVASGQVLCVAKDLVPLRESPQSSYVVLEVPRNYPLQVLESRGNHLRVSDYLYRTGWVEKSEVSPGRCGVVDRSEVNLRAGPGTEYEVVFRALEGVALQVVGSQGNWLRVRQGKGSEAWIYSQLVWGIFE